MAREYGIHTYCLRLFWNLVLNSLPFSPMLFDALVLPVILVLHFLHSSTPVHVLIMMCSSNDMPQFMFCVEAFANEYSLH